MPKSDVNQGLEITSSHLMSLLTYRRSASNPNAINSRDHLSDQNPVEQNPPKRALRISYGDLITPTAILADSIGERINRVFPGPPSCDDERMRTIFGSF
jgi:hypothetical protein